MKHVCTPGSLIIIKSWLLSRENSRVGDIVRLVIASGENHIVLLSSEKIFQSEVGNGVAGNDIYSVLVEPCASSSEM